MTPDAEAQTGQSPPGLSPGFRPPWWLRNPHLQTLGGKAFRSPPSLSFTPVRLDTPDDDFLELEIGPEPAPGAPVVLVLHGLEGSSRRSYVRTMAHRLHREGMLPVAMNFRGCSGEPNWTPRAYHSGETGDLGQVVAWLRGRFPGRALGAVGFSLGGNVLLKYQGEAGAKPQGEAGLDAVAALSVPFDLSAGATELENGPMARLYSLYFLTSLRRKLRDKAALLDPVIDLDRALSAPTIRLFDEFVTAPLHGFDGAEDYYRRSSCEPFLNGIRAPALLIQSHDDPFLPADVSRRVEAHPNPALTFAFTDRGGHVGFIQGSPPLATELFGEDSAAHFLRTHLGRG